MDSQQRSTKPFFWILIPVFFILKNAEIYRPVLHFFPTLLLLCKYLAGAITLYAILFRVFRKNHVRSALFSAVLLTFFFFYASFDTFLQQQAWLYPFSRYRWSLPAAALIIIIAFFLIRRMQKPADKTIRFLNLLLILFCLSAAAPLLYASISPGKSPLLTIQKETRPIYFSPVGSARPNIYFLLFDEYQGNDGLQKLYNYPNTTLRNALAAKGFFSPRTSRSNYNLTFYSMPSIFNMGYLEGDIQGKTPAASLVRFLSGMDLIKNSRMVEFLQHTGYGMIDLSPFPLDESGIATSQFQPVPTRNSLFTDQTLSHFMIDKFSWMIPNKKILHFLNPLDYNLQFYNEYVREHLIATSATPAKTPAFVYAHLFIPHSPYLRDSAGNDTNFQEFTEKNNAQDHAWLSQHYLAYLKYANSMLVNSIDAIVMNDPNSIIVVMSDHGERGLQAEDKKFQYNNQFYVRTPQQSYAGWPDTVDGVNAFRIILNHQFDQKLQYLEYRSYEFNFPDPSKPLGQ